MLFELRPVKDVTSCMRTEAKAPGGMLNFKKREFQPFTDFTSCLRTGAGSPSGILNPPTYELL